MGLWWCLEQAFFYAATGVIVAIKLEDNLPFPAAVPAT